MKTQIDLLKRHSHPRLCARALMNSFLVKMSKAAVTAAAEMRLD